MVTNISFYRSADIDEQKNDKGKISGLENEKTTETLTENEENPKELEEAVSPTDNVSSETDSSALNENSVPKKVERKIKHPKTNVVSYDEPDLDAKWGWAIEFTSVEQLTPIWEKLKSFLNNNKHPIKGKANWLSMDPRGYFSPRLRHFISFTGWGIQIEKLPDWFKENIADLKKPIKLFEPSEELAEDNWQGYIVKEKITLDGPEFIQLEKFSRNKRKTVEEAKNPVSSKVPRYWGQKALYNARDYLVPVITTEKYKAGELSNISYLEEYIVEQLEWQEPSTNTNEFVILPSDFSFDENAIRKIKIPEEYTPEIEFDYPGMFPGMGGLGGMDGMPDLGDMPDLDDSELGDLDSDENEDDSGSDEDHETMDAEIVPDDK